MHSRTWRSSTAPTGARHRHSTRQGPGTEPRSPGAIDRAVPASEPDTRCSAASGAWRRGPAASCRSQSGERRRHGGAPAPTRTVPPPDRVGGRRPTTARASAVRAEGCLEIGCLCAEASASGRDTDWLAPDGRGPEDPNGRLAPRRGPAPSEDRSARSSHGRIATSHPARLRSDLRLVGWRVAAPSSLIPVSHDPRQCPKLDTSTGWGQWRRGGAARVEFDSLRAGAVALLTAMFLWDAERRVGKVRTCLVPADFAL